MDERDLRSRVIRLAHTNPALRPHLLPLLNEKRSGQPMRVASLQVKPFSRHDWNAYNGAEPFDGNYKNEDPANQPLLGSMEFPRPVSLSIDGAPVEVVSIVVLGDRQGVQVEAMAADDTMHLFILSSRLRDQGSALRKMEWAAGEFAAGDVDQFDYIGPQ